MYSRLALNSCGYACLCLLHAGFTSKSHHIQLVQSGFSLQKLFLRTKAELCVMRRERMKVETRKRLEKEPRLY